MKGAVCLCCLSWAGLCLKSTLQSTFEPSYIRQDKQVPVVSSVPGECGVPDWDDQTQCHNANCGVERLFVWEVWGG